MSLRFPRSTRRAWITALLPALLLTAGCNGGGSTQGGSTPGGSGGSAGGGTLTVATTDDVKSVDPALAFDTWSTAVVHAITRRLVDYDAAGKLVPDLAEKWDISPDGKSYTFHLRTDAKFDDDTPIQAENFVLAIRRVQDPKTASPGAGFYSNIAKVEAKDAHTLLVTLKAPEPTLLNAMGMTFTAPVKEGQSPDEPAASGPYRLESFSPGSEVVLARNPFDVRNPSKLAKIVVQLGVDQALQLTRFTNGEVDLLPAIPPAQYAQVMSNPAEKERVAQGVVNQTWYFGLNTTKAPWNNPKIRRAALLALDRNRHVQIAGAGQLANGVLPPHVPGYNPDRKVPDQNVEEARRLVAEAGFAGGVPKSVLWLASNEQNLRHAEAIASDLQAVGIPVELRPLALSQFLTGYRKDADCWYNGWYPDFPDAGNFLEPVLLSKNIGPGKSNAARYRNPKFDALVERAHTTPLGPEREGLYRQAEDRLLEDLPWIPLYFEQETRYFREGVTGVTVHPVWRQMLTGIDKR
jgi:ABC-type transport system substrate-binding protein